MLLGHYGVAFAAKRWAPEASLGTLAFAAQWSDELWPILLLLGLERVRVVPGLDVKVGLGAWRSIPLRLLLEGLVSGGGLWIYLRATSARDAIGRWGLWAAVALLVLILLAGFGPPPPSARAVAVGALGLWLVPPIFWWIDRHRDRAALGARPSA